MARPGRFLCRHDLLSERRSSALTPGKRYSFRQTIDIDPVPPISTALWTFRELIKAPTWGSLWFGRGVERIAFIRATPRPAEPAPVTPRCRLNEIQTVEELYLTGLRLREKSTILRSISVPIWKKPCVGIPGCSSQYLLGILFAGAGIFPGGRKSSTWRWSGYMGLYAAPGRGGELLSWGSRSGRKGKSGCG